MSWPPHSLSHLPQLRFAFLVGLQENKAGPRPDDDNGQINEGASCSKMPDLPPDVDSRKFKELFSLPEFSNSEPCKKVIKIFAKKQIPEWLKELGEVKMTEQGKNAVEISESLLAMIAGFESESPLEFGLISRVNWLREIIQLGNEKIPENAPLMNAYRAKLGWQIEALKGQLKGLFCMLAFVNSVFSSIVTMPGMMESVILPGLKGLVDSIEAAVRHLRFEALPRGVSPSLKFKFVDAPVYPLWPEEIINEIRQFFQARRARIALGRREFGRARGRFASGHFRRRGFGWPRFTRGGRRGSRFSQRSRAPVRY